MHSCTNTHVLSSYRLLPQLYGNRTNAHGNCGTQYHACVVLDDLLAQQRLCEHAHTNVVLLASQMKYQPRAGSIADNSQGGRSRLCASSREAHLRFKMPTLPFEPPKLEGFTRESCKLPTRSLAAELLAHPAHTTPTSGASATIGLG